MHEKIIMNNDYFDPSDLEVEIVERKGIGHPDSLADGLAEAISSEYSKECIKRFGHVLHHNVDKLYIGAGLVSYKFGSYKVHSPIEVRVNGRMSDSYGRHKLDIKRIQTEAIKKYLAMVLPRLDVENDVKIFTNATQKTNWPHWYKPRSENDLPESKELVANDTSVCVASFPFTLTELITYELEHFFWEMDGGKIKYRYSFIGQDIKVMVIRRNQNFDITVCAPILSTEIRNLHDFENLVKKVKKDLTEHAKKIAGPGFTIQLAVNEKNPYVLGIGSCVESGEEGLVGRGNSLNGIISMSRPHSVEAFSGKNPKYHTGRVLGYFVQRVAKAIYEATGSPCTVICLTKIKQGLLPPYLTVIQTKKKVDKRTIISIIDSTSGEDYLKELLTTKLTLQEGMRPWQSTPVPSTPVERR